MKGKTVLLIILVLLIIILIIFQFFHYSKQEFEGYIAWKREAVVFVKNIEFDNDTLRLLGNESWVEQNDLVKDLYNKARIINENEDLRVIKVKFQASLYKDGGFGHLGEYDSKIKILKIFEYSDEINV